MGSSLYEAVRKIQQSEDIILQRTKEDKRRKTHQMPQPKILQMLVSPLDTMRTGYSRNFAAFLTEPPQSDNYQRYRCGLILLVCLLGIFFFILSLILIWLKIYGKSVSAGCATGLHVQRIIDTSDGDSSKGGNCGILGAPHKIYETDNQVLHESTVTASPFKLPSESSSREKTDCEVEDNEIPEDDQSSNALSPEPSTQICLLIFGVLTIICLSLCAKYCYIPLVQSVSATDDYISDAQAIVNEVASAASSISRETDEIVELLRTMYLDFPSICPGITGE
jgi:hypothetical protein